ncbi:MAG: hypothetical protein IT306_21005 [Chloroflexi bacterium]|nr:hypothetical protein [Chloroflexota bacterium]
MTLFRLLQVSVVIVLLFGSTWVVRVLGMAAEPPGSSPTWLASSTALAGVLSQNNNDNSDNSDNSSGDDNSDNSDNDGGGDNNSDNNDNESNGNDNGYDDNDNFNIDLPPIPTGPVRPPEPECAQPGQDTTFTSRDGKATVRVFASTPRPVRIEIYQVIDFLSAPLPPGNLVGLLAYEIRASYCDSNPLSELPAEVNLGIRYSDLEATGLDESRFVIGRLDVPSGVWTPVEKRGNDPSSNFVSATISQTGFYMVWELRP